MQAYLRFLDSKLKLQTKDRIDFEIDLTSQRMLELVALSEFKGRRLTVSEAMSLQIYSPATLHKKIQELVQKGYLTLEFDEENRKTKYLRTTTKTVRFYEKLGNLLLKSNSF